MFRTVFCLAARAVAGDDLLNLLFMADIGHPREHADQLTTPWPMGKCAYEGAFSLYEGMYEYITMQKARPTAAVVIGDVAYGGGEPAVNNATRQAFQKYLAGVVPEDRVFVAIGNHDIHFLGCSPAQILPCNFGSARKLKFESTWQMPYEQWASSWTTYFPGMVKESSISPPRLGGGRTWLAPTRYNINLEQASSVYLIVGMNSGSTQYVFQDDTPAESTDAKATPGLECEFLRDSLAHGRSLGKTVMVYMTHHFNDACDDWGLIQQVDVWIYGHKHSSWVSTEAGEVVHKEHRHYPVKLLIGNGGFDEADSPVVSFGHVTEEVIAGGSRVRLTFRIFDTCEAAGSCPSNNIPELNSCWTTCQDRPGGFDNGGGPRKATPSTKAEGFLFEAPLERPQVPAPAPASFPQGSFKLRLTDSGATPFVAWLATASCPSEWFGSTLCLVPMDSEEAATVFSTYDEEAGADGHFAARLAVDNKVRAPVRKAAAASLMFRGTGPKGSGAEKAARPNMTIAKAARGTLAALAARAALGASAQPSALAPPAAAARAALAGAAPPVFYQPAEGFWDFKNSGEGEMRPADGYSFKFAGGPGDWKVLGVAWYESGLFGGNRVLSSQPDSALNVSFVAPSAHRPLDIIV